MDSDYEDQVDELIFQGLHRAILKSMVNNLRDQLPQIPIEDEDYEGEDEDEVDDVDALRIERLQRPIEEYLEEKYQNEDDDDDVNLAEFFRVKDIREDEAYSSPDKTAAALVIIHHHKHIVVSVFPSTQSTEQDQTNDARPCLEDVLIPILRDAEAACQAENENTFNDDRYEHGWEKQNFLQEKAFEAIMDVGKALFLKHAPPINTIPGGMTVQDMAYPPHLYFQIQTIDGRPKAFAIRPEQSAWHPKPTRVPQPYSAFKRKSRLPNYCASKLRVLDKSWTTAKVSHRGELLFCKIPYNGLLGDGIRREIDHLHKFYEKAEDPYANFVAVPLIKGYVTHAHSGAVIGYVTEWIQPSRRGRNLAGIDTAKVSFETRRKWGDRIEEAMEALHAMGFIWGDCKPAHIVIDRDDDAYLVDFRGIFTQSWVDKDVVGTLEGDAIGLAKILKYLGLEDEPNKKTKKTEASKRKYNPADDASPLGLDDAAGKKHMSTAAWVAEVAPSKNQTTQPGR